MKHLKSYKNFNEDVTVGASTAGMGAVVNSQPGALPGTTGTDGSGDLSFYLKRGKRRKKGGPTEVSDMRDLAPVKTNKIVENISPDTNRLINDCLIELFDEGFEINSCIENPLSKNDENYYEGLHITLSRRGDLSREERKGVILSGIISNDGISELWLDKGSKVMNVNGSKDIVNQDKIKICDDYSSDLGEIEGMTTRERKWLDILDECAYKLLNHLGIRIGYFFFARFANIGSHQISMQLCYKGLNESTAWTEQEYLEEVQNGLKLYNIRPVEINKMMDFYEDEILSDFDDGKDPKSFIDRIVKEMELGQGGFLSKQLSGGGRVIKYL